MKKALLLAPMSSVHEKFNAVSIEVLHELGYEIHTVANFELTENGIEFKNHLDKNGITTHHINFVRGSLLKNIKVIPQLKVLFKTEQFDIVHCHTETGGVLTRLAMGASIKTKYIFTPHGMSFYEGSSLKSQIIYRLLEKWICKKMNVNIAINDYEYKTLLRWNEKTAKYTHGIGIDLDEFQHNEIDDGLTRETFGIPDNAKVVLSIGELNENKNHKIIIKALSQIRNENIYYLICGAGHLQQSLKTLAIESDLEKKVILTGYRKDIPSIINLCDIFAFPSFHEGLPVSVMEAMSAGLPVVCSKIRGNVDLIIDGESGFLCKSNDISSFKCAVLNLIENDEMRQKMGDFNKQYIKIFSKNFVKQELLMIYKNI